MDKEWFYAFYEQDYFRKTLEQVSFSCVGCQTPFRIAERLVVPLDLPTEILLVFYRMIYQLDFVIPEEGQLSRKANSLHHGTSSKQNRNQDGIIFITISRFFVGVDKCFFMKSKNIYPPLMNSVISQMGSYSFATLRHIDDSGGINNGQRL